jgi:hypothetical protein
MLSNMENKNLCKVVHAIPPGSPHRRWTLRADYYNHFHGGVRLSESPLYLELHWRLTANDSVKRVGLFHLEIQELLHFGYVRTERNHTQGYDVRLRIVRADDGCFYVQAKNDGPRILLPSGQS